MRLEDLTGAHLQRHAIWVNDLSGEEEAGGGFDESSLRPVLSGLRLDRTSARTHGFLAVSVAVRRVPDGGLGVVDLTPEGELRDLAFWEDGAWSPARERIEVEVVPAWDGRERARLEFDPTTKLLGQA